MEIIPQRNVFLVFGKVDAFSVSTESTLRYDSTNKKYKINTKNCSTFINNCASLYVSYNVDGWLSVPMKGNIP